MRLFALTLAVLVPLSQPAFAARQAPTAQVMRATDPAPKLERGTKSKAMKVALASTPSAAPKHFTLPFFGKQTTKEKPSITLGDRMSDKVAAVAGSWKFIGTSSAIMVAWMAYNGLSGHPFDAPPYVGLNLVLSTVAALQAPFILMSQNRQSAADRLRLEADFEVNRHAEHEIEALHTKIDALTMHIEKLTLAQNAAAPPASK